MYIYIVINRYSHGLGLARLVDGLLVDFVAQYIYIFIYIYIYRYK